MDRVSLHHLYDGYRDASSANTTPAAFPCLYSHQHPLDHYLSSQEDLTSCPNTPSMTRGPSSRSTSSSVLFCDHCGNFDPRCKCQSESDTESIRFHPLDADYTKSPASSPASLLRPKDAARFQRSCLRDLIDISALHSGQDIIKFDSLPSLTRDARDTTPSEASSSLFGDRNNISLDCIGAETRGSKQNARQDQKTPDFEKTDSDLSENEDDENENDDDCDDYDNDWSGQDDNLEAIVVTALGGDLELASYLIPMLHRSCYTEQAMNLKRKVGPWWDGLTRYPTSAEGAHSEQNTSPGSILNNTTDSPRKRQRLQGPVKQNEQANRRGREDEETDGEGDENPKEPGEASESYELLPVPRLACPFHKRDPVKYGIQYQNAETSKSPHYRSCEGPGFNTIQRLKEHLKRKHYPVQCDRCWEIFPGSDRATCALALETHRQLPDSCERKDIALKEGISDAQWAKLDKKRSVKKDQASSRVEKYWEIWDILFPNVSRPSHPWYDFEDKNTRRDAAPTSGDSHRFAELFGRLLEFQVGQQHICFPPGLESEMSKKVKHLVQQTFQAFVGIHDLPSSTNSSSSRSNTTTSMKSSSSWRSSDPGTSNEQRFLTSQATALTYPDSLNKSSSAVSQSLLAESGGSRYRYTMAPLVPMPSIPQHPPDSNPHQLNSQRNFSLQLPGIHAGFASSSLNSRDDGWPTFIAPSPDEWNQAFDYNIAFSESGIPGVNRAWRQPRNTAPDKLASPREKSAAPASGGDKAQSPLGKVSNQSSD